MVTNGDTLGNSSNVNSLGNSNLDTSLLNAFPTAILDNGSLTVDIREDNGAIDTILFSSSDFFNSGTPVSDFGFQNGTDVSTFVRNDTSGFTQQPVSVTSSDNSVVVTGTYTGGDANVSFTRTYSWIEGLNALRIDTDFVNNGSDVVLRYFDTFDPDQGVNQGSSFDTFNDVLTLDTGAGVAEVGQATASNGLTFVLGSLDPDVTVASGNPFSISDGFTLNNFFDFPFDGNGTFVDSGTHIGIQLDLDAGETESFEYFQAYGATASEAQEQFLLAIVPPVEVIGTEDSDVLSGTNGRDIISGLGGSDILQGIAGNDQIDGGSGDDLINGGEGNDTVEGGTGDDLIFGEAGNDTLSGNEGQDDILGGEGNDQINGGADSDRLLGEAGDDTLTGEGGNDTLDGGIGNDTLDGGNENDRLFGGSGNDTLTGGDGEDRLIGVDSGVGFGAGEVDTFTGSTGRDTFVLGDSTRAYYEDGNPLTTGEFDYALISDFNATEDVIQLRGSADVYLLDLFTTTTGTIEAALIYDPGVTARGEVVGILQNVSSDLSLSSGAFTFV
jgi:Ca2+-binding RTX toxin-like protein